MNLPIPGMKLVRLDVHSDNRGWFAEWWQSENFARFGIEGFRPVQSNISSNVAVGVTRGMHAEPWNKLVTIVHGKAFLAWVDLRAGANFGSSFSIVLEPGQAVYVPRGVANGYQTLTPGTVYVYLVDEHWEKETTYVELDAFDPEVSIDWPLDQRHAIMSAKDARAPRLREIVPLETKGPLIVGPGGMLGKELTRRFPNATQVEKEDFWDAVSEGRLHMLVPKGGHVINAAAFTDVDGCEDPINYLKAIKANALAPALLSAACSRAGAVLIHISTEYVFDGQSGSFQDENLHRNPLNFYGSTKSLGEDSVMGLESYFLIRTSWLYGNEKGFVQTMRKEASEGRKVTVVNSEFGRPTSVELLADFIEFLLRSSPKFGIYNLTSEGPPVSRFQLAQKIYELLDVDTDLVQECDHFQINSRTMAARPRNSLLSNKKAKEAGFEPRSWLDDLVAKLQQG